MINVGRKVKMLYTAWLEDGTVLDSSGLHDGSPLEFVLGSRQVIPGLEKAVQEMSAFEKRRVTIPAAEAYGEYDATLFEAVPADEFPDVNNLPIGEFISLSLPHGRLRVKVDRIESGMVYFDLNHEYAGQDLTFDIEIVEIYGETGSIVENEQHSSTCGCGCHKLKEQLTA